MKKNREKYALIAGMIGCLLYVVGDYLFAAIGKNQSPETIGMVVRVAYLDMSTWRMVLSIICGMVGTALYYVGFDQMWKLLKAHLREPNAQKYVKAFRISYLTGTICWGYVHAMFMNIALIFKFTFSRYGDISAAAEIANKVFYSNALPMLVAFIIGDGVLSFLMIIMVWNEMIPLKTTKARILATLCNPIVSAGIIGNAFTLLSWPINQIDIGSESFGHLLVLVLGLILLKDMSESGELMETAS